MTWEVEAWDRYVETAKKLDGGADFGQFHLIHLSNLYLLTSYLYYELDASPLMSDTTFDHLCHHLLDRHADLKPSGVWWVEKLFPQDALSAGTGYHLTGHYPDAIKQIAAAGLSPKKKRKRKTCVS